MRRAHRSVFAASLLQPCASACACLRQKRARQKRQVEPRSDAAAPHAPQRRILNLDHLLRPQSALALQKVLLRERDPEVTGRRTFIVSLHSALSRLAGE